MSMSTHLEVVDDSEPERQLKRSQRKPTVLRDSLSLRQPTSAAPLILDKHVSVIEISDDSIPPSPIHAPPHQAFATTSSPIANVVELSDSSCVEVMSRPPTQNNLTSNTAESKRIGTRLDTLSSDDSSSDPEELPCFNVAKFAFKAPVVTKDVAPPPSRALCSQVKPPSATDLNQQKTRKGPRRTDRFASEFTDAMVDRILKCVCCDTQWTLRKSAAQKMVHIQSCAKKHSFTDETVRVMLRKELESLPGPSESKRTENLISNPDTVFQNTVRDGAPKRRTKRTEAAQTVRLPTENRETIIRAAQGIIGHASGGSYGSEDRLDCTLPLGQSKLGLRQDSPHLFFGHDNAASDGEDNSPPFTQAFAPSILGNRNTPALANAEHTGGMSDLYPHLPGTPIDISSTSSKHSSREPSPLPRSPSPRTHHAGQGHDPYCSDVSQPEFDMLDDEIAVMLDDAYLHYDPDAEKYENIPDNLEPALERIAMDGKGGKPTQFTGNQVAMPGPRPRKRRGQKRPNGEGLTIEFNEEWERKLEARIRQETSLYLRILRYEPLPINLFVQLACSSGAGEPLVPTRKMLYHVRAFLDKHGVTFYTPNENGRRRH